MGSNEIAATRAAQAYSRRVERPAADRAADSQAPRRQQGRDTASISPEAGVHLKTFQAVQRAPETPEVKAERLARLREQIHRGDFEVDVTRLAIRLLAAEVI